MEINIETNRVFIRPLMQVDVEGMFALDSNPEVHKFVGNQPIKTIDESRDVIEMVRAQYIENGVGRWAMLEKTTGDFIGWIGFKLIKDALEDKTYMDGF